MGWRSLCIRDGYLIKDYFMSKSSSSILIYGICETPSILWDVHNKQAETASINRQFIVLADKPATIKIGSSGWAELKPEELLQFENNDEMVTFTKELIFSKANAFSKPIKNALRAYFRWVEQKCIIFKQTGPSSKLDPIFSNVEQLFFNAPLPLPHPKITLCDKKGNFTGVVNFDLSFIIDDMTYLLSLSEGQFIRKSERELREQLIKSSDKFKFISLTKPQEKNELDNIFINDLLSQIPALNHFLEENSRPHSIYHASGLEVLNG